MDKEHFQQLPATPLRPITGPVELFATGQCMAFDNGEQIGELQKSFMLLWAENAIANGYNPEGVVVKTPRGYAQIVKSEEFGWSVKF